jgi:hypothetical protein
LKQGYELIDNLVTELKRPPKTVVPVETDLIDCMDTINAEINKHDSSRLKNTEVDMIEVDDSDVAAFEDDNESMNNNFESNCSDAHKFALFDVFAIGQEKMKKQNIHSQRLRKKQRSQRHDHFMLTLYDDIISSNSTINANIDIISNQVGTSRDLPTFTSTFRKNKFN